MISINTYHLASTEGSALQCCSFICNGHMINFVHASPPQPSTAAHTYAFSDFIVLMIFFMPGTRQCKAEKRGGLKNVYVERTTY